MHVLLIWGPRGIKSGTDALVHSWCPYYPFVYFLIFSEPRSCVLDKDDLKDGLRILMYMDGLFYEGQVKGIQPPDV